MTRWQQELEKVRAECRGVLKPKLVVAAARNPKSALHSKFEWNNGKAADAYRLIQAASLIRSVTFLPGDGDDPIRAYVSLSSDRLSKAGFRAMVDVLSDADLLKRLIADAREELAAFTQRYDRLRKVAKFRSVFAAADKVKAG